MKARWFRTCGALLACATLTIVACGDDSTPDAGAAGTGAGGAGAGGTGGGSGSTAGKSGGGGGGSMAVTCGGVACTVNTTLKSLNPAAAACCTPGTMKCGQYNTSMKCLEKNAPGTPDKSCPDIVVTIMGMAYPQAGCCTPAKKCGGNYTAVEYGCVAREDADMGMGGPLVAMACGAGDGGGDAGL